VLVENFSAPIHASLHRPLLIFGGEREMVLSYGIVVFTFMFAVLSWWSTIAGIVMWVAGQWGLSKAAKFDFKLSKTGLRALRYRRLYLSRSTPFARLKEWK